jgi:hypothetical protein
MVPTRRHFHARNSYSNCGGRERDMVHSLTPEHLSIGGGLSPTGSTNVRLLRSQTEIQTDPLPFATGDAMIARVGESLVVLDFMHLFLR